MLRYLAGHEIQLPVRARSGPAKGDLEWRRPTRETLQNMLRNPAYAGYYAYGRRQVDPRRKIPGRPDTGKVVKPAGEWLVMLAGRLPAYICEDEYRANLARLAWVRRSTGGAAYRCSLVRGVPLLAAAVAPAPPHFLGWYGLPADLLPGLAALDK